MRACCASSTIGLLSIVPGSVALRERSLTGSRDLLRLARAGFERRRCREPLREHLRRAPSLLGLAVPRGLRGQPLRLQGLRRSCSRESKSEASTNDGAQAPEQSSHPLKFQRPGPHQPPPRPPPAPHPPPSF